MIEDIINKSGASTARIDFGEDAYIEFDFKPTRWREEPNGWRVVDNRRRYPQQVAASLSFDDAARFAKSLTKDGRRHLPEDRE